MKLKSLFVLVALFAAGLYLLFSKDYEFDYEFSSNSNVVVFNSQHDAITATKLNFHFRPTTKLLVECVGQHSGSGTVGGDEASMLLVFKGQVRHSLSESNLTMTIPISKIQFIETLQQEIDGQMGITGCKVRILNVPPAGYKFDESELLNGAAKVE